MLARPYVPARQPLVPPAAAADDAPARWVQINNAWISHILGLLQPFTGDDYWAGTQAEIDAAVQQAEEILEALSSSEEMPTMTLIPVLIENVVIVETNQQIVLDHVTLSGSGELTIDGLVTFVGAT